MIVRVVAKLEFQHIYFLFPKKEEWISGETSQQRL